MVCRLQGMHCGTNSGKKMEDAVAHLVLQWSGTAGVEEGGKPNLKVKVRAELAASSFLLQALPGRWLPTGSPAHGHSRVTTGAAKGFGNPKKGLRATKCKLAWGRHATAPPARSPWEGKGKMTPRASPFHFASHFCCLFLVSAS